MKIKDLENKRIAIWGLGVEGKAVLKVLNEKFPNKEIKIIDDKNCPPNKGTDVCLLNQLRNIDIVIRSPGVSIYKDEILFAKKNFGVTFITEKTIFFGELESKKIQTIAITGTKGKTTTSTFCAYLLEKLGYKVLLAGNMGVPTIELLNRVDKYDFVVIEISSYQASDLLSFPEVGILLNLFPEHINWHLTHENYYRDKTHLLGGVKYKIVNGNDERAMAYTKDLKNKILFGTANTIHYRDGYFYNKNERLFSSENMKLLGEHNYQNLCSVLTALHSLKIDFKGIKQEYFDGFKPVEHRLETIDHNGILFVNDSISTIPEATIACYKIFKNKDIYGILGGYDREQDYSELVDYIASNSNIKFLALIGQTGKRISESLAKSGFNNFKLCNTLDECVEKLYNAANNNKNSVIILSPASASYDMYKNFEERGKHFKDLINKY